MRITAVSAAPFLPEKRDDSAYIFMIPTSCQNSDEVPRPHERITPPPREAQARNNTICRASENQEFLLGIFPDHILSRVRTGPHRRLAKSRDAAQYSVTRRVDGMVK